MDKNNNIIICSGFKCASCTLSATFNCMKTHNILPSNIDNIDIILIPFNNDLDKISKSAYFQDIIVPSYPYSPFNEKHGILKSGSCSNRACGSTCTVGCTLKEIRKNIIKNIDVDLLIDHYNETLKSLNWNKDSFLNNEIRCNYLCKELNINLCFNSKKIQVFNIEYKKEKIRVIYFHVSNINDNFDNLKLAIFNERKDSIQLKNSNIGDYKWYSDKYNEFKKKYKGGAEKKIS